MKDYLLNPDMGECDIDGCTNKAVAGNGVGGRLCSYHI